MAPLVPFAGRVLMWRSAAEVEAETTGVVVSDPGLATNMTVPYCARNTLGPAFVGGI